VTASLTSESFLQLTAEDGRNIEVDFVDTDFRFFAANHLGFNSSDFTEQQGFTYVKTGNITLQSEENFTLASSDISVIGFDSTGEGIYGVNSENSVSKLDISDRDGAIKALDTVDLAIEQTSSIRSMLGALQNRLQSTISNITVAQENLSASRSRIMDADFAQETAMLSRNQIIQQASVSIIAQAVQQPQSILALLGS